MANNNVNVNRNHRYCACYAVWAQGCSGNAPAAGERLARMAYVSREGYTHLEANHPPNMNVNEQRLSSATASPDPELQRASVPGGLPLHINLAMIEAPVDTRDATLAIEGYVPPGPTRTLDESYFINVHYSCVFRHPALPGWGADSFEQRNLFAWENHTEFLARGLGSRRNPIVVEDSPSPERVASPRPAILLSDGVPPPFIRIRTLSSGPSNVPASPAPPPTSHELEYSPTSHFGNPLEYYGDTLTTPATPHNTSNSRSSFTTLNAPTSPPPPTAFPEFGLIAPEYGDYPILDIASASIMPLSPTPLHPALNSPYPTSGASPRTTSSRSYGIESPDTNIASPYDQQLPSPSESVPSESGYVAGSEGYTSQGTIYCNNDNEEGPDERDINEDSEPEESPEILLTWVEIRVDTGSEVEEEA